MIPGKHANRYFYHFTHMENVESIIDNGLISTNEKKLRGIDHVNIANKNIQNRRSGTQVPCHPHGSIHDYVPFYFAGTNPMLLSVLNNKNIDQPYVVYIAVSINKLKEKHVIYTDASANTITPPNFYSDPQYLDNLNWTQIDSKRWGTPKGELNARMAEVLVYNNVPLDWIECFIVFNELCKKRIKELFKEKGLDAPKITYEPFNDTNFYFTKFFFRDTKDFKDRGNESLVTGPKMLKALYNEITKEILDKRSKVKPSNPSFLNVKDAIVKIKNNFCIIDELKGINKLETKNDVHSNTVCEHTKDVVKNLSSNDYYIGLDAEDKSIVKLAAYFHDIGKGPKSKWKDGVQPSYADHPVDSLKMMERILVEEFEELSEYEINLICLLVGYHDLIGEILGKGRSEKEIRDLELCSNELDILAAITLADIKSINSDWFDTIEEKIPDLLEEILDN
ncbi:DarT ssDNA thymidine ADP-ribosyltransferase family protein [Paenibacillus sp. MBLB2552]|uniref:DarT ssDNA thymidine ADP-ribosyltransferase family protein n=1 Tax=Paenibacillus mellifer TaxID=2937794 RepID=A0A9X2BSQ4_9BACL|nr:DarT ssDNA thymidine ADP-ribosyltransferase family protein [Paenibacillus mellifer]MCK8487026.1 DarT ssDNA thymidine ADP-ribosyltransferase family protein [Paenibacillus mellifer]